MKSTPKIRPLTSSQVRAARGLLRWSAEELAREVALGLATIRRAVVSHDKSSITEANDLAVRQSFENAGVEFIDENGGGLGVRLRKLHQKKSSTTEKIVSIGNPFRSQIPKRSQFWSGSASSLR